VSLKSLITWPPAVRHVLLRRGWAGDRWLRASLGLAFAHAAFVVVVRARPGLPAVVLWYVVPPLLALAGAILLALALVRTWREGARPGGGQLAGLGVLVIVIASLAAFRTYPSSHDDRPSRVPFRLPLDGPVTVAWGGPTLAVNYHAVMPDQRWSYDLVVAVDGRTFSGDGSHLEDYHAYGRPVRAPADGVVESVQDGEPDGAIGQWRVRGAAGNHVVLRVAPGEFLFIAHLQRGSISVLPGDRVVAGQAIGRVGNSGNSSEPHVHLHLQDRPAAYLGEGIPFYFHDYRLRGVEVARGMPVGGRERRSRRWPGALTGDVVEQITRSAG
jgi:hypothetical protein